MNVGILGHVDSGKTTLARALSTLGSTAAFDKHANASNLRANTIELGFSTLSVCGSSIALIDCPGHASLVRAVLAASTVFDMAIVVIDAAKGIEPQAAEHLLLVSILCPEHIIVVLNKIDLTGEKEVNRTQKQVKKALDQLNIARETPVVSVSLLAASDEAVAKVLEALRTRLYTPHRDVSGKFVMSVDHCFPIKGKGTVMTGTLTEGSCRLGMDIEIPFFGEKRKIKGMERWKESVQKADKGDRVALLVASLPEKHLNRTIVFEPGALPKMQHCLADVKHIPFFKGTLGARTKIHISLGFDTVMATCQYLRRGDESEYEALPELGEKVEFVLLSLEQPVYAKEGSFYLASKLDSQGKGCRFAFHGKVLSILTDENEIRRFHRKRKIGKVERIENERSLICCSLFKKETDLEKFKNMQVRISTGEVGVIEGAFGKSGKIRVRVPQGLRPATLDTFHCIQTLDVELFLKKFLNDGTLLSYIPSDSSHV